ncbi:hypothetical protein KJZ99_10920 [bacterium]|nr:hypothetical protein [bacterium]
MKTRLLTLSLLGLLTWCKVSLAQSDYSPGDWQSYRDCRGARAMDVNPHELFVATGGGVLTFQLSRNRWEAPQVMGYGAFEAVPIDDAILLLYDERYNHVWVATRDQLLKWQRGFDRWEIAARNVWMHGERPVNIGVGGQSLYVETIPDQVFEQLFTQNPPLPDPEWRAFVRRYRGDRSTGNLFLDMIQDPEEMDQIRWRGLRSKLRIPDSAYPPGVLAQLPAGFPYVMPPRPYTWYSDGTLYDPRGRSFPVTDWLLDSWGNFWSTHWGAGVLKSDLRALRSVQLLAGPAGNDVKALLFLEQGLWIGGANDGDFLGVSFLEGYGNSWSYVERRDDSQIRSTNVSDLVSAGDRIWFATMDGLLSYQPRKKQWKRFDVQDNLHAQQVTALAVRGTELWIGTHDGLSVLDTRGDQITRIPSDGFALSGILDLVVHDSLLYVGTEGGLTQVNARTHEVTRLPLDPGLLNLPVSSLSLLNNDLWLATPEGIMRRTASGETKSWLSEVWMKNAVPTCVDASNPFIWVGTEAGFFRFDPSREAWEHYTRRDGLVDDYVQVIKEDRGDLWIGTRGGLTRYYYSRPGAVR